MPILAKGPNSKKKPNNMRRKELVNWEENPLSLNSGNNGSQAHEINKWILKCEMASTKMQFRKEKKKYTNEYWHDKRAEIFM